MTLRADLIVVSWASQSSNAPGYPRDRLHIAWRGVEHLTAEQPLAHRHCERLLSPLREILHSCLNVLLVELVGATHRQCGAAVENH